MHIINKGSDLQFISFKSQPNRKMGKKYAKYFTKGKQKVCKHEKKTH